MISQLKADSVWVIGDVHGCALTLDKLLRKIKSLSTNTDLKDHVIFVGDLIDRGPHSRRVVEIVMHTKAYYHSVLGNHEHMLLEDGKLYYPGCWQTNGGDKTILSYESYIPADHIEWLKNLPTYIDFPNIKNDKAENLFVSHTGVSPLGNINTFNFAEAIRIEDPNTMDNNILWYRGAPAKLPGKFHIFGHTPVKAPVVKDYYANVDTGCAYAGRKGYDYGKLTAIRFPDLLCIQEAYCE